MSDSTSVTLVSSLPPRARARREYRHRAPQCSRLLFNGYLPPGTYIEIRCPACGRMHVIQVAGSVAEGCVEVEAPGSDVTVHPLIDTEHRFGYDCE